MEIKPSTENDMYEIKVNFYELFLLRFGLLETLNSFFLKNEDDRIKAKIMSSEITRAMRGGT